MKQSGLLIVVSVVLLIGAVGFLLIKSGKQNPSPSNRTSQLTPPPTGQTKASGTVPENLTFSGAVNGQMSEGRRGDSYTCLTITTGPIVGKVGNTDYTFEFRALNAKGPGSYKGYVQIGPLNNKNLYYGGDNVALTINADKRSGSVEGDLSNLTNSAEKVHISGSWTCPPDF